MIRQLVERFTPDARKVLSGHAGVFEVHVHPDNSGEVNGGLLTAPPSEFLRAWHYCIGDFAPPFDLDEKQFIAVIHDEGVVLTELES
jgi:hypothetical protein